MIVRDSFKPAVLMAGALLVSALTLVAGGAPPAVAQTGRPLTSVLVENDAASPVPVTMSGSTTVTGSVTVANPVQVANFPAVQNVAGSVAITGVPTVALQQPTPFHDSFLIAFSPGFASLNVPPGKRLVIQSISVTTSNFSVWNCGAVRFNDTSEYLYDLSLTDKASSSFRWCFGSAAGEALFWSTGPTVFINLPFFNADGDALFRVNVSGYLAD